MGTDYGNFNGAQLPGTRCVKSIYKLIGLGDVPVPPKVATPSVQELTYLYLFTIRRSRGLLCAVLSVQCHPLLVNNALSSRVWYTFWILLEWHWPHPTARTKQRSGDRPPTNTHTPNVSTEHSSCNYNEEQRGTVLYTLYTGLPYSSSQTRPWPPRELWKFN